MFALFLVLHAAEVPIYSVDALCYETTSKACSRLHAMMEATGEEVGTDAGVRLNQFIYAAPSNATSALAKTNAEIVVVYVQDDMTGKDQDIFDLAALSQNVMLLFAPIVSGADDPSMMKNLVAEMGRIRNLGTQDGFRSMAKGAQALAQLSTTKSFGIKRAIEAAPLKQCDPEWDPNFAQVHLTATSDVFSKVNTIFCYSQKFVFHAEIHIPCVVYYGFALGYMTGAQYFKPDYTLTLPGILGPMEYEGCGYLSFKNLGLLEINRTDPVKLDLTSTGWRLEDGFSFIIPYKQVSGYFSVIEVSNIDIPLQVNVDAPNGAIEIQGFNVSVQAEINMGPPGYPMGAKTLQEKPAPKLIVTFDPDWDKKVSNTPEIILEAADPTAIQVNQQPTKVSIKKTSIADRPSVPAPSSGGDDDPNKPDTALIVGIVVAVVAVIAIVVVIVVFVVMKKKKAQVQAESTHGVCNDSRDEDHNTNDQQHSDADHPSPE